MAKVWTDEQTAAFSERKKTLLVSAAAGSGKTATLTERILRTLTDPSEAGDISRMLVVTFTRAAAGELRTRIARELSRAISEGARTAHLSRQLLLLPAAHISTIDSFCLDLVRAHAVRLGLSPSFRLADAAENRLLLESLMDRLLDEAYAGTLSSVDSEDFLLLADALAGKSGDHELLEILLSLYDSTRGFTRSYHILSDMARLLAESIGSEPFSTLWGGYIRTKARDELESYLRRYREALSDIAADEAACAKWYDGYYGEEQDLLGALDAARHGYTPLREALSCLKKHKIAALPESKKTEATRRAQAMRDEYFKAVKDLGTRFFAYEEAEWSPMLSALSRHVGALSALLEEFGTRVEREKRRRGVLDFADVAHAAYALLYEDGQKTPLAREMAASYDYVYVDEYQDVNELQHRIFEAISPERGRFMVGDVKQSIYGFRGAQPELFAKTRTDFPPYERDDGAPAASLSLSRNFRSFAPILSFVNLIFGGLMQTGLGAHIGYEENDRLIPGLTTPPDAYPVTVALFSKAEAEEGGGAEGEPPVAEDASTEDGEEGLASRAEVDYVADTVSALLKNGKKADGTPLRAGDFAILVRGNAAFEPFASALEARGIPVERPHKKGFFLNPEILLALSLLNVIDNPRRDVHLAGLLRSPLYGFTMDELIAVRRRADSDPDHAASTLYEALVLYAGENPSFEKGRCFLDQLAAFRRMAEGSPVDRLLWHLYRETGLLAIAGADKEGEPERRRANLMLLYDYARRFEASSFRGLYNFIAYINDAIERGQSIEEKGETDVASDAVQIMTMHHAKGLEFPVCFVSDTGRKLHLSDASAPLVFDRDYGCALSMRDPTGYARLRNPVYRAISSVITERQLEEEMRILYVALTRARERLYVTGTLTTDVGRAFERACVRNATFGRREAYACRSFAEMILAVAAEDRSYLLFGDGELLKEPYADLLPFAKGDRPFSVGSDPAKRDEASADKAFSADEEVSRAREILRARFEREYPYRYLTDLPTKLSVSRLYPTVLDGAETDTPTLSAGEDAPPSGREGTPPVPTKADTGATPTAEEGLFAEFCFVDEYGATRVFRVGEDGRTSLLGEERAPSVQSSSDRAPKSRYLPRFMGGMTDEGAARGTATHLFLQFADFSALARNGAEAELSRLLEERFLTKEDGALVRLGEVAAFTQSRLFAAIAEGGVLYRELRFHVRLPAAAFTADPARKEAYAKESVLVQGVMDGVLLRPDGELWLFDYKTDRLTAEERKDRTLAEEKLRTRYRSQLSYYAAACRSIFGRSPDRVMIYSLALGDTVEVDGLLPLSAQ